LNCDHYPTQLGPQSMPQQFHGSYRDTDLTPVRANRLAGR
jgi:hypothetical protein